MFERMFFVTTVAYSRKTLFRSTRFAELFIETLYGYRKQEKFLLHEFVLMPDHFHALLTPNMKISLERAMQFIKGGFSRQVSKRLGVELNIWQPGFENHRVRDLEDYESHRTYIHMNPVRAGLVANAAEYPHSSANPRFTLDPP